MNYATLSEKKIGLLIWQVSIFWQNKLRYILNQYGLSLNEHLIIETIIILKKHLYFALGKSYKVFFLLILSEKLIL